MSMIRRLGAMKHLWMLKRAGSMSESSLNEVKSKLIASGPSVIEPLLELLEAEEAKPHAWEILRQIVSNDTIPDFVEQLSSEEPGVPRKIAELLSHSDRFDPMRLIELVPAVEPRARGLLESILHARVKSLPAPKLVQVLSENAKETRLLAHRLLENVADASIVPLCAPLLAHEDWWMRFHVLTLLARFATEETIAAVLPLLKDTNNSVRLEAVTTLGKLDARAAIPQLCQALRDENLKVHTAAIDVLVRMGDASAVIHLVDVLKDESEYARRGAVEVLNQVATPDAVRDLVTALRDEDWWVRVRAADALGSLGGEKVVEAVLGLMDNDDEFLRRYAVEILNTVPDQRAVMPLIKALGDVDWWVRERSIDALAKTKDPRSVEPLLDLMLHDLEAAPLCARALGQIGDESAIEPLMQMTESSSEELRRESRDALGLIAKGTISPENLHRIRELLAEFGARPSQNSSISPFSVHAKRPLDPEAGRAPVEGGAAARRHDSSGIRPAPSGISRSPSMAGSPEPAPAVPPAQKREPSVFRGDKLEPETELLGRYRVKRRIGSGGFGTVYLVEDSAIREDVILKLLSPHISEDKTMIKRFIQELKFSRKITHKNIIRIHDFLDLEGAHAISMEYFPSEDLSAALRHVGKFDAVRGVPIAAQTCEGLIAAHGEGIIHRDIKPPNVLLGKGDIVKIVDFGLASMAQNVGSRLTKSGILIGTPQYMAPEQITGETIDARTDIYSLGVMFYEMFTGVQPFKGDTAVAILFSHLEAEIPTPRSVCPEIPEKLDALIQSMMAKSPDARPQTCQDVLAQLQAAL